jgi:hypothetical protein
MTPVKTWKIPLVDSANWSYNCKRIVSFSIFPPIVRSHIAFPVASELDTLRAETQTANEKSASAATQTAAMLSLNLKLQSTASKNHAKQIELEVKTIESREVKELLAITQASTHVHREATCYFLNTPAAISSRRIH